MEPAASKELVAEGDIVLAHFRCHGTQTGPWLGTEATARVMRVDEAYFFTLAGGLLDAAWAWGHVVAVASAVGYELAFEAARSEAP